jgi:hypothetical protein
MSIAAVVPRSDSSASTTSDQLERAKRRVSDIEFMATEATTVVEILTAVSEGRTPQSVPRIMPHHSSTGSPEQASASAKSPDRVYVFAASLSDEEKTMLLRATLGTVRLHYETGRLILAATLVPTLQKFSKGLGKDAGAAEAKFREEWGLAADMDEVTGLAAVASDILEYAFANKDLPGLAKFYSFKEVMALYGRIRRHPADLARLFNACGFIAGRYALDGPPDDESEKSDAEEQPVRLDHQLEESEWGDLLLEHSPAQQRLREQWGLRSGRALDTAAQDQVIKMLAHELQTTTGMEFHLGAQLFLTLQHVRHFLKNLRLDGCKQALTNGLGQEEAYAAIVRHLDRPTPGYQKPYQVTEAIRDFKQQRTLTDVVQLLQDSWDDISAVYGSKKPTGRGKRRVPVMRPAELEELEAIVNHYQQLSPQHQETDSDPNYQQEVDWRIAVLVQALSLYDGAVKVLAPEDETDTEPVVRKPKVPDAETPSPPEEPTDAAIAVAGLLHAARQGQSSDPGRSLRTAESLAKFKLDAERINLIISTLQAFGKYGVDLVVIQDHLNIRDNELPYMEIVVRLPDGREAVVALHMERDHSSICYVGPKGSYLEALRWQRRSIASRPGYNVQRSLHDGRRDILTHAETLRNQLVELEMPPDMAAAIPDTLKANRIAGKVLPYRPKDVMS